MQRKFTAIAAAMLGIVALGPGFAVAQSGPVPTQEKPLQASEIPEEKLDAYAAAAMQVVELDRKWRPQIQAAESTETKQQLSNSARTEMVGAVESEGLSVEEYNEITTAAESDPALLQRLLDKLSGS